MIRKVYLMILVIMVSCLPAALKRWTHSFHLARLSVDLPEIENANLGQCPILPMQEFDYLSRGSQSFVFTSRDQTVVLKLFLFDPEEPLIHRFFHPDPYYFEAVNARAFKTLNACRIAFQHALNETKLIYIHLQPSDGTLPSVRLNGPSSASDGH